MKSLLTKIGTYLTTMKNFKINKQLLMIVLLPLTIGVANAQAGGLSGLDDATKLLDDIFDWGRIFVLSVASLYFLYLVIMAFLERKTWTDVMIGGVWCIIAGAAAMLAKWAVGIYAGAM